MSEQQLKAKHKEKHQEKLDSFTLGSATKTGSLKFYFDSNADFETVLRPKFKKMFQIIDVFQKTRGYVQ